MITSVTNQKVKRIVQLNKKAAAREEENVFVAEGIKMFLEAPPEHLKEIYVSESLLKQLEGGADLSVAEKLKKFTYEVVSNQVFQKMSDTRTPQGILCVVKRLTYTLEQMAEGKENPLFLILESLQDPGNLGTIIRTGECAGISGLILSKDTVDIYNPKTIRSTMGAIYRLPFLYTEDLRGILQIMKAKGIAIYASHLKGRLSYDKACCTKAAAFLIGNEGNGLTEETTALADERIKIPMAGQAESLNAGVAAALLMYEAARQRQWKGTKGWKG